MERDITVEIGENIILNCRSTGIIIHNNKVLLHHTIGEPYYAIMGGRIHIGEDSETAVIREYREELNKEIEIIKYLATIENFFFTPKGKKYHEISFLYQLEFKEEADKKIEESLKCIEKDTKEVVYDWINIDELEKYDIRPKSIINIINGKDKSGHIINNDKRK